MIRKGCKGARTCVAVGVEHIGDEEPDQLRSHGRMFSGRYYLIKAELKDEGGEKQRHPEEHGHRSEDAAKYGLPGEVSGPNGTKEHAAPRPVGLGGFGSAKRGRHGLPQDMPEKPAMRPFNKKSVEPKVQQHAAEQGVARQTVREISLEVSGVT